VPEREALAVLTCAIVHKSRVVAIAIAVVFGTGQAVVGALERSRAIRTVATSSVERNHGTDRHDDARKSRRPRRLTKDRRMQEAITNFIIFI
jgi:hypothetical protein